MNALMQGSLLIVMSAVFAAIAAVVTNSVLMSVLERTREFGALLALGSPPGFIVRMVLIEAALVGVAGSLAGLALGSLAAWAHGSAGMSMKSHGMAAIPGITDVVYPQLSWAATVQPAVLMPLAIVLVALYPAWRASRLDPVRALRSV